LIVRAIFAAAFLALGIAYYYSLGPPPSPSELMDLPWWRSRGFLVRWARSVEGIPWGAVLVFAALPQALVLLGIRLFSRSVARALVFAFGLTLSLLTLSGFVFPIGWSFFSWRFPVVVLASALFCSGAFFLPSLLESALRQARTPRALIVCGGVLSMYVLSTEITGWEPSLQANLSPWPILTLFGFLLIGYLIASLHLAAGLGAALDLLANVGHDQITARVEMLSRLLTRILLAHGWDVFSPGSGQPIAGIVAARHSSVTPKEVVERLAQRKVVCSTRQGSVRFSPHFYTTKGELEAFDTILEKVGL